MMYVANLLEELNFTVKEKVLHCDNLGAIYIAEGANATKIKHIEVKWFWLREKVEAGLLSLSYVESALNIADIFTKPLKKEVLNSLKKYLVQCR